MFAHPTAPIASRLPQGYVDSSGELCSPLEVQRDVSCQPVNAAPCSRTILSQDHSMTGLNLEQATQLCWVGDTERLVLV
jgi:hypothetical protein